MADTPRPSPSEPSEPIAPTPGNNTEVGSFDDATNADATRAAPLPAAPGSGSPDWQSGQMLGVYRLEQKLGEGGMGAVWKALHTKLGKTVALKVLPKHLTSEPALVSRFEREMKAVGLLDHPHIIRAMDAGEIDGLHYLVMEYVSGVDLATVVRQRGPQQVLQACEMIRQAALGLAYAHEHGLIHRDIKPTNLLLSQQGQVKILDLGLARLQEEDSPSTRHDPTLTTMGQIMGTPDYMAPEQWDDTHSADGRTDLYALGCTLFFLLIGRPPYSDEKHRSMKQKFAAHCFEEIPDLRAARQALSVEGTALDEVPEELAALYRKMLAKPPEERFQSADELLNALVPIIQGPELSATLMQVPVARPVASVAITAENVLSPDDTSAARLAEFLQTVVEPPTSKRPMRVALGTPGQAHPESSRARRHRRLTVKVLMLVGCSVAVLLFAAAVWRFFPVSPSAIAKHKTAPKQISPAASPPKSATPEIPGQPVLVDRGAPISPSAAVAAPPAIDGLRSWTIGFVGHGIASGSVTWSPTGKMIATGGYDGTIRLWTERALPIKTLYGHDRWPVSMSFSRDGALLASLEWNSGHRSRPAAIRIWHVASGACVAHWLLPQGDNGSVSFSPMADEVAFYVGGSLGVGKVGDAAPRVHPIAVPNHRGCAWSADGKSIVTAEQDELVTYDAQSFQRKQHYRVPSEGTGDATVLASPACSPDGNRIAAWNHMNGVVHLWDATTARHVTSYTVNLPGYNALAWSSNNRWLLATGGNTSRFIDGFTGKPLKFQGGSSIVALSPDGKHLAEIGHTLNIYEEERRRLLYSADGKGALATVYATIAPNGTQLLLMIHSTQSSSRLVIADPTTGARLNTLMLPTTFPGGAVSFASPRGDLIAAIHAAGVLLVDPETGKARATWPAGDSQNMCAAWSPDGRFLAITHESGQIEIRNVDTGQVLHSLAGHDGKNASVVVWSPDGTKIATGGGDYGVSCWDAATGELLHSIREFPMPTTHQFYGVLGLMPKLAWTPDSRQLWIGGNQHAGLWDLTAKRFTQVADLSDQTRSQFFLASLSLSSDGEQLLANKGTTGIVQIRVADQQTRMLGPNAANSSSQWWTDNRQFFTMGQHQLIATDAATGRLQGRLYPAVGTHGAEDHWLCVGPTGHYRGSDGVEQYLIYNALFDDGRQETFTPVEFRDKFGWRNDPEQATLLKRED